MPYRRDSMLAFVDYEHADRYQAEGGDRILAARARITYRLEDLAGEHCMLVRYDRVTPELFSRLGVTAIFISGNGTDLDRYDSADLAPLAEIVRTATVPIFGFCGGFQFIASALGVPVVPLDAALAANVDADDRLIATKQGLPFEFGYHPVKVVGNHAVLDGCGTAPVFRHAHGLHVPTVPDGFAVHASTDATPVQLAVHEDRRIVGTQFHPEYWTDEHPHGKTLIANFLRWADLI